jgi:hypothetical protein
VLAVAAQLLGLGEQVRVRLAAIEERDLVSSGEGRLDGRAAEELRPAEHQELHGRNAIRPQGCGFLTGLSERE